MLRIVAGVAKAFAVDVAHLPMQTVGTLGIVARLLLSLLPIPRLLLKPLKMVPAAFGAYNHRSILPLALCAGAYYFKTHKYHVSPAIQPALMAVACALVAWVAFSLYVKSVRLARFQRLDGEIVADMRSFCTGESSKTSTTALGNRFEIVVERLFSILGYGTKANGTKAAKQNGHVGSGDGGWDLEISTGGFTYLVSCKRFMEGAKVGPKDVKDIHGSAAMQSKLRGERLGAVIVTTNGYSEAGTATAKSLEVTMFTQSQLIEMVLAKEHKKVA